MQYDPAFLALLLTARMSEISRHDSVPIPVLWKTIIAMGPVDRCYLFTESGTDVDPDLIAPLFRASLSQMATPEERLIMMVDDRVCVTPLGHDKIEATNAAFYEEVLNQFTRAIPTLVAA
jgi:hypothetical protein